MATASPTLAAPEVGELVRVRDRHWMVTNVVASSRLEAPAANPSHLVELSSVEDDAYGDELTVFWEVEPGTLVLPKATLPQPSDGFDDPGRLAAFLDAVRWGAIASADARALPAPFRSGISIEDYQLDPVVRALQMPRVNLLIADDVGLGNPTGHLPVVSHAVCEVQKLAVAFVIGRLQVDATSIILNDRLKPQLDAPPFDAVGSHAVHAVGLIRLKLPLGNRFLDNLSFLGSEEVERQFDCILEPGKRRLQRLEPPATDVLLQQSQNLGRIRFSLRIFLDRLSLSVGREEPLAATGRLGLRDAEGVGQLECPDAPERVRPRLQVFCDGNNSVFERHRKQGGQGVRCSSFLRFMIRANVGARNRVRRPFFQSSHRHSRRQDWRQDGRSHRSGWWVSGSSGRYRRMHIFHRPTDHHARPERCGRRHGPDLIC